MRVCLLDPIFRSSPALAQFHSSDAVHEMYARPHSPCTTGPFFWAAAHSSQANSICGGFPTGLLTITLLAAIHIPFTNIRTKQFYTEPISFYSSTCQSMQCDVQAEQR